MGAHVCVSAQPASEAQSPHLLSPWAQEEAASGLEQWEMVVGAARLYDWSGGSRLRSPRASLQRGPSSDSQAPDTLRTRPPPPLASSA